MKQGKGRILILTCMLAGFLAGVVNVWKSDGKGVFQTGHSITVVARESGSGTRAAFCELFGIRQETAEAVIVNRSGTLLTLISEDLYAVGYGSMQEHASGVKCIAVDGVNADLRHIETGEYPFARPLYMAVRKTDETSASFLRYVLSETGQDSVRDAGYLPVVQAGAKHMQSAVPADRLSAKLILAGSSSMAPLADVLAKKYEAERLVDMEFQQCDSSTGILMLMKGMADVALLSRDLTEAEKAQLTWAAVAMDGLAVFVNEENPVESLSKEDVRRIFQGEERVWE